MAFSSGLTSATLSDILDKASEADILYHYFNISSIPCVISSPLRVDNNPSFGIYTLNGSKIYWKDLSTNTSGGLWDMLGAYWGISYRETLKKVLEDLPSISTIYNKIDKVKNHKSISSYNESSDLQCKVREWKKHDIEYWQSFGISLDWLKYANIYPISHKIVIKGNNKFTFAADKYAYAYVEKKEGKVTLKIYQPFNTNGYKWSNKHDRSVISLWTKIPEYGEKLIICSSMKDALCIWATLGIPCIAIQGEGYGISNTAISELKRRYKEIYIALDGDKAGVEDSKKLQEETDFKIVDCPLIGKAKDWSDIYHYYGKEVLSREFNKAIKETQ